MSRMASNYDILNEFRREPRPLISFTGERQAQLIEAIMDTCAFGSPSEYDAMKKRLTDAPEILAMHYSYRDEIPRIVIGQVMGYRIMIKEGDK